MPKPPQSPAGGNTPKLPATVPFDEWRFFADKDGTLAAKPQWLQGGFDDSTWQRLAPVPWNLVDKGLRDYRGTGLYRAEFTPPAEWRGRHVVLGLYSFNTPIVYDEGEFLLNGATVTSYKARGWSQTYAYDVTDKLKQGPNVLAVRVKGGKEFSGVAGAVWLAAERKLQPALDLGGPWQTASPDFRSTGMAQMPGRAKACFMFREVDVPAAWKDRSIFLHLETATQWLGSVVVNGRPINYNGYLHPFGLRRRDQPHAVRAASAHQPHRALAFRDDPTQREAKGYLGRHGGSEHTGWVHGRPVVTGRKNAVLKGS